AAFVVIVTDVRFVHLTRPKSRDQKPVESALAHQMADPRPAPIALSQRQDWRLHWDIGHDVSFRSSRPCTRMRLLHKRQRDRAAFLVGQGYCICIVMAVLVGARATRDLPHAGCGACLTGG